MFLGVIGNTIFFGELSELFGKIFGDFASWDFRRWSKYVFILMSLPFSTFSYSFCFGVEYRTIGNGRKKVMCARVLDIGGYPLSRTEV